MCKKEKIEEKTNKFGCRCLSVFFALIFACGMNTDAVGRNISSGNIAENFPVEVAHKVLQMTGKNIVKTKDRQTVEVEYVVTYRNLKLSADEMYKAYGVCSEDTLIRIEVDDALKAVIGSWNAQEFIDNPDAARVEIENILKEMITFEFRFTNVALHKKSSKAKKRRVPKPGCFPEWSEMIVDNTSSALY